MGEDDDKKPRAAAPRANPDEPEDESLAMKLARSMFGESSVEYMNIVHERRANQAAAQAPTWPAWRPLSESDNCQWVTAGTFTSTSRADIEKKIKPIVDALVDKRVRELLAELVVKPLNEVREALRSSNIKYGVKMLDDVVTALESASPEKDPP